MSCCDLGGPPKIEVLGPPPRPPWLLTDVVTCNGSHATATGSFATAPTVVRDKEGKNTELTTPADVISTTSVIDTTVLSTPNILNKVHKSPPQFTPETSTLTASHVTSQAPNDTVVILNDTYLGADSEPVDANVSAHTKAIIGSSACIGILASIAFILAVIVYKKKNKSAVCKITPEHSFYETNYLYNYAVRGRHWRHTHSLCDSLDGNYIPSEPSTTTTCIESDRWTPEVKGIECQGQVDVTPERPSSLRSKRSSTSSGIGSESEDRPPAAAPSRPVNLDVDDVTVRRHALGSLPILAPIQSSKDGTAAGRSLRDVTNPSDGSDGSSDSPQANHHRLLSPIKGTKASRDHPREASQRQSRGQRRKKKTEPSSRPGNSRHNYAKLPPLRHSHLAESDV